MGYITEKVLNQNPEAKEFLEPLARTQKADKDSGRYKFMFLEEEIFDELSALSKVVDCIVKVTDKTTKQYTLDRAKAVEKYRKVKSESAGSKTMEINTTKADDSKEGEVQLEEGEGELKIILEEAKEGELSGAERPSGNRLSVNTLKTDLSMGSVMDVLSASEDDTREENKCDSESGEGKDYLPPELEPVDKYFVDAFSEFAARVQETYNNMEYELKNLQKELRDLSKKYGITKSKIDPDKPVQWEELFNIFINFREEWLKSRQQVVKYRLAREKRA